MKISKRIKELKYKLLYYTARKKMNGLTANDKRQYTKLKNKIAKLEARLHNHRKVAMTNRENGNRFEFKLLRKEKRNGILALRSAGSHSLIDVVSIKKNGTIHLINAKSHGYHDPKELNQLRELKKLLPDNCIIKLACYSSPKKYTCKTLK